MKNIELRTSRMTKHGASYNQYLKTYVALLAQREEKPWWMIQTLPSIHERENFYAGWDSEWR